jgi:hypothetical protein
MTQIKKVEAESEAPQNPLAATYVEQQTTSPEVDKVTDNADFSKTFQLSDGKKITLRDMRAKDLLKIERSGILGNLSRAAYLTEILTVEYGSKTVITTAEVDELSVGDLLKLSEVIASFFD